MRGRRLFVLLALALFSLSVHGQNGAAFRPPAVPLVASDPYLSIWSEADRLTDDETRHWTHAEHSLTCLVRIDGKTFRLMGRSPQALPALPQTGLRVTPTRTLYRFANSSVQVTLTFMTPLLPDELDVFSRPVTYLTWTVRSADGGTHRVALYQSVSSELAVNSPNQTVNWDREQAGGLTLMRMGSEDQTMLRPQGDDVRIDWGYAYLAARTQQAETAVNTDADLKHTFIQGKPLAAEDAFVGPRTVKDAQPVMAVAFDCGLVSGAAATRQAMIGYDEIDSIDYFGTNLPPYWRRNVMTPAKLFETAAADYDRLAPKCEAFDRELTADAAKVGGSRYAQIVALAYRECIAATGLAADSRKQPLLFTKENTSNGDIATVDVIFPMEPMFILLSPSLAKASLVSNFDYAASPHWKFPNAPHDLGTYPRVFGRDDGGEGMPVEESGNMILVTDAIAHSEGNAEFAGRYWPQLTRWAQYLEQYGLDPEDQLCTDDFMGHLAHNANLSVKAILALAAYGDLCRMRGEFKEAKQYGEMAKKDASHWVSVAEEGDHSRLAFDQPGTWSQKYNLVWDRILGLNVFPPEVARNEIAFYKTKLLPYGLPLDSRTHLTKTDWSIWSATMADSEADFEAFVNPIYRYLNETSARDPIADSYMTDDAKSGGMHARPVVGGFFIRMLTNAAIWHKWATRDHAKVGNWAPMPRTPLPPVVTEIVPTARTAAVTWRYTTAPPAQNWAAPGFNDRDWQSGESGLGTEGTPGIKVRTIWNTDDIWIRRTFTMPRAAASRLRVLVYHDEDVEVYINGVFAASEPSFVTSYSVLGISPAALKLLKPGAAITLAAHCHQTEGGQGIDVGLGVITAASTPSP